MSSKETVYERLDSLEDELGQLRDETASLREELDILKHALRNKIARHEISQIKKGNDITSIID